MGAGFDAEQQLISPWRLTLADDGDLVISGPRSVVPPLARVGGSCLKVGCELNEAGKCTAVKRDVCPGWVAS